MNMASDESVELLDVHSKAALLVIVLRLKFHQLILSLVKTLVLIFQSCAIFLNAVI